MQKDIGECYEKARVILPQAKVYLGQKLKETKKDSSTVLRGSLALLTCWFPNMLISDFQFPEQWENPFLFS